MLQRMMAMTRRMVVRITMEVRGLSRMVVVADFILLQNIGLNIHLSGVTVCPRFLVTNLLSVLMIWKAW